METKTFFNEIWEAVREESEYKEVFISGEQETTIKEVLIEYQQELEEIMKTFQQQILEKVKNNCKNRKHELSAKQEEILKDNLEFLMK